MDASGRKLRAVYLAALLTTSVFAGAVVVSTPAAAGNQSVDRVGLTIGEPAAGNVAIWAGATNGSSDLAEPVEVPT